MTRTCVSAITGASSFTNARTSGDRFDDACAQQSESNSEAMSSEQKAESNTFRMNHAGAGDCRAWRSLSRQERQSKEGSTRNTLASRATVLHPRAGSLMIESRPIE